MTIAVILSCFSNNIVYLPITLINTLLLIGETLRIQSVNLKKKLCIMEPLDKEQKAYKKIISGQVAKDDQGQEYILLKELWKLLKLQVASKNELQSLNVKLKKEVGLKANILIGLELVILSNNIVYPIISPSKFSKFMMCDSYTPEIILRFDIIESIVQLF